MAIVRFNPMRDLLNVEREFNRLFNTLENRLGVSEKQTENGNWETAEWMPLTDIYENNDNYILKLDLPGMKREDVKLVYINGQLSISGERKLELMNDLRQHRIERTYGKFYRTFSLPQEIQQEKIEAEFKDGQLTITIPKAEEAKPKELDIKIK